jgi:Tfp pilus assembly protein FimV
MHAPTPTLAQRKAQADQIRADLERQAHEWAALASELDAVRGTQLCIEALPEIKDEPATPAFCGVRG